jgi:hypothetical protein
MDFVLCYTFINVNLPIMGWHNVLVLEPIQNIHAFKKLPTYIPAQIVISS